MRPAAETGGTQEEGLDHDQRIRAAGKKPTIFGPEKAVKEGLVVLVP